MDPVSGAIGVADVSVRLVKYLIEFREEMGSIDEGLDNLIQRIEGLTDLLLTIDAIKQPGTIPVDNPNKAEGISNLWMHLDRALANCREVLLKLEEMVQGIRGESVKQESRKFDTVRKVLRKRLKDSDLRVCQSQLAMHQDTLQVVVNIITMHNTGSSQDDNARSFQDLSGNVENIKEGVHDLSSRVKSNSEGLQDILRRISTAESTQYDKEALVVLEDLRDCVTSAERTLKATSTNHHFDIPQSVSSIFTGRGAMLKELRELFVPRGGTIREFQRRFIVHGLGGSGKTQFCCKFAEDCRNSFWGVFWIDASTEERIKHTLRDIAETAGLERNEKSALHWLSSLETRWLLIIDNADNEKIALEKYFPRGNRGNVLVTTRNPDHIVHGNVGRGHFEFSGLHLNEATQLLLKASKEPMPWDPTHEVLAVTITEHLGSLALAIIQAGAAIRSKLCSLKDYLSYYKRKLDKTRSAPLAKESSATDNAAYATWEICHDRLEQSGTEAARDAMELLKVLAFLHRESISQEIFTRALRSPAKESQPATGTTLSDRIRSLPSQILEFVFGVWAPATLPNIFRDAQDRGDPDEAEDRILSALRELSQMSLIIRSNNSDSYSMHPIIHRWARERPKMRLADQAVWAEVTGRVLASSILLPPLIFGTAASDERYHISLLPHVEHVQACRKSAAEKMSARKSSGSLFSSFVTWLVPVLSPDAQKFRMYARFSVVYFRCGRWESAELLLEEVTDFLCRHVGPADARSRQASLALSKIYWERGRSADAVKLQTAVVDLCSSRFGQSHPDTLRAMTELGRTRWQQGQYTIAREIQEKALNGLLLHFPPDNADVLLAKDNLGLSVQKFWGEDNFAEAFRLHSDAAEGFARVYGPDHDNTLWAKGNLCRVAVLLGGKHLDTAPRIMAEVLEMRRAKLGKEHPHTLLAQANMAIVLSASGKPEEAETLVRQGLPVADRTLGLDHIGPLFGRQTLAAILIQLGRYSEAEELLMFAAERQKRMGSSHGDYHPDRLCALIDMARCCFYQGKLERAVAVCDEAIRGFAAINVSNTVHPLAAQLLETRDSIDEVIRSSAYGSGGRENVVWPFILFKDTKS